MYARIRCTLCHVGLVHINKERMSFIFSTIPCMLLVNTAIFICYLYVFKMFCDMCDKRIGSFRFPYCACVDSLLCFKVCFACIYCACVDSELCDFLVGVQSAALQLSCHLTTKCLDARTRSVLWCVVWPCYWYSIRTLYLNLMSLYLVKFRQAE